jgi:hypothetical protein
MVVMLGGTATSGIPVERMRLTSAGTLGLNNTAPAAAFDVNNINPTTGATNIAADFTTYGDATRFVIRRANGTLASPTKVISGNSIGALSFRGYYEAVGSGYSADLVSITANALEDFTSGQGTNLLFDVSAIGSTVATEQMRIDALGVGINTLATNGTNNKLEVKDGHIANTQTTAPTCSCARVAATCTVTAGDTDESGTMTCGGGGALSSVTLTFNMTYAKAPVCIGVALGTGSLASFATRSTTAPVFAIPSSVNPVINYICR